MRILLLLLTISLCLFLTFDAGAKVKKKGRLRMTFGPKIGLNMQEIYGGTTYENAYKPGFNGGIFISVNRRKHGLRAEALVNMARFNAYNGKSHVNAYGLSVPMLYEVKVARRLWFQFGPQFSTLISAKRYGTGWNGTDVKNTFRNADVSAVAGLEVSIPRKWLVGVRYSYGFIDVNNTSYRTAVPETMYNRGIQLYVCYRYY